MTALTADAVRAALDADDPKLNQRITLIKISTRRRKGIGMDAVPGETGITVTVPAEMRPEEAAALLSANRHRIGSLLVKASQLPAREHPTKELINGAGFLLLGHSNRLRLVDQPDVTVRHTDDLGNTTDPGTWRGRWIELDRATLHLGADPLIDWYISEGNAWLASNAAYLWTHMAGPDRPMPHVRVDRIGRTRWGVHTQHPNPADDTVRLAWQLFQLRPLHVRHVLTHEFVHALRPGGKAHGPQFWRTFERAEPGARIAAKELDKDGATVWMGDVHTPALATR